MRNIIRKIVVQILEWEARLMLARTKPKIIGVTGSVGKTSTKDAIYTAVSVAKRIKKNEKSMNSEFGVPLTILGLNNAWSSLTGWLSNIALGLVKILNAQQDSESYLVLEMGADHPGDIRRLAEWVQPQIGVVTGLGGEVPVHVEYFHTIEDLVREKAELLRVLPESGLAVLNIDDARVWDMRSSTRARVISFGTTERANVKGSNLRIRYENGVPVGLTFRVEAAGKIIPVYIPGVLGKGHMYSTLAAVALAGELQVNLIKAISAIETEPKAPGRLRLLAGINGSTLIDDTYNSSPAAVKIALEALHEIDLATGSPSGDPVAANHRKIAVLGDMRELGKYEEQEHKNVGEWVRGVADVLVCVGSRAKIIGESALADGCEKRMVYFFQTSAEAGNFLKDFVSKGDVVLLKASQSVRLERATEVLLADPIQAKSLLVRQEKEWLSRS